MGAAGAGEKVYVEDVFSTFLYTGTGSSQTITNNIDLSGEGGLVWCKIRDAGIYSHALVDTARGRAYTIGSDLTDAQYTSSASNDLVSFNSNGFTVGSVQNFNSYNRNGNTIVSWTFRKAKKFFDIVTYTGNGSNRTISHNLGSVPGCIIVKKTSGTDSWAVYHRSAAKAGYTAKESYLILNSTQQVEGPYAGYWNNTDPTSTVFTLGNDGWVNGSGSTYVAYLFAHDAGGFGNAGSDNVISCGSFTTDGSGNATVSLGYEPQYILMKKTSATQSWVCYDTMRGWAQLQQAQLYPNVVQAEDLYTGSPFFFPTATGFSLSGTFNLGNNDTFIYIAIRRGPMKTPTSGTSVFAVTSFTGVDTAQTAGFPVDLVMNAENISATTQWQWVDRLRGANKKLESNTGGAEGTVSDGAWDSNITVRVTSSGNNYKRSYPMFRRAPGFFDIVCYTGTGSATTVSHNLGVVPELMIVKSRNTAVTDWAVYSAASGATKYQWLNTTDQAQTFSTIWNDTAPTSSVFTVGSNGQTGGSGRTYVAYLFASLSGVSKVGSYTGNGSSVTVTTNFQPRFILVKRTDSTGDWIVSDSARGLVAGNDPYLRLNSTAAEVTNEDWVDITSTSFTVNQTTINANVNNATYIFLAIA